MGGKPREARRYACRIDDLLNERRDSLSDEDVEFLIELREFLKRQAQYEPSKRAGVKGIPIEDRLLKVLRLLKAIMRIAMWILL